MSNPLPITFDDKVNSPELIAFLQQFGQNLYVDANEINQIKNAVNWLYNNTGGGSGVTNNTGFIPGEGEYVFNALFGWKFNGEDFALTEDLTISVPYASAGKHRIDLIAAYLGTLIRIPGPEVPIGESAAEPVYNQLTHLRITAIPVNESGYGTPSNPLGNDPYYKKSDNAIAEDNTSGTNVVLEIPSNGASHIKLINPGLLSVKGISKTNILAYPSNIHKGKRFVFYNETGGPLSWKHDVVTAGAVKFNLKKETDLVLPDKERIEVVYDSGFFLEIFNSAPSAEPSEIWVDYQIDGNVNTPNSWHSWVSNANNWDQSSWLSGPFGNGTTLNFASAISLAKPKDVPAGYKMVDLWFFGAALASSGTTNVRLEAYTNNYVSGQLKTTLSGSEHLIQHSWTMGAAGNEMVENKQIPIDPHSTFTDLTKLFLFFRWEGSAGGLNTLHLKALYRKQL